MWCGESRCRRDSRACLPVVATGPAGSVMAGEVDDQPVHDLRFLSLQGVSGIRDDPDLEMGDAGSCPFDDLRVLHADFVISEHEQNRSADAVQLAVGEQTVPDELQPGPAQQSGKIPGVLAADMRRGTGQVAQVRFDGPSRGEQADPQRLHHERPADRGVDAHGRGQQHDLLDPLGCADGRVERDPSPLGVSDQQRLPDAQRIEDLRRPACVVRLGAELPGGLALPGIVHRVDEVEAEALSQLLDIESPHEGVVAGPVEQQQRSGTCLPAEQHVGPAAPRRDDALLPRDGPVVEDPVVIAEQLALRPR